MERRPADSSQMASHSTTAVILAAVIVILVIVVYLGVGRGVGFGGGTVVTVVNQSNIRIRGVIVTVDGHEVDLGSLGAAIEKTHRVHELLSGTRIGVSFFDDAGNEFVGERDLGAPRELPGPIFVRCDPEPTIEVTAAKSGVVAEIRDP